MKPEVFRHQASLRWLMSSMVGIIVLLIGIGAVTGFPNGNGKPGCSLVGCLLIWLGTTSVLSIPVFWLWRERIIADEKGLRWRKLGREQRATWDEVTDYFITLDRYNSRAYVVKFADGRVLKFDSSLTEFRRLELLVAAHAGKAKSSGWLVQSKAGTLTDKLVCSYTVKQHRKTLAQGISMLLLFGLMGLAVPFLPDDKGRHLHWGWAALGLIPGLVFGYLSYLMHRESLQRRGERFEADLHGFTFYSPHAPPKQVQWTEVRNLRRTSVSIASKWLLETREDAFPIFESLENYQPLLYLIRSYSPAVTITQTPTRDALLPTEKTDGKRTFHYRTRSNRVLLGALLAIAIFPLWIAVGLIQTDRRYANPDLPPSPTWIPLSMVGLLVLWWAGALWRYKVLRIVLDAEGVTQVHLLSQVRIGYEEITCLRASESTYSLETKDGRSPIQWSTSIADAHELREELEARTHLQFQRSEFVQPHDLAELVRKVQNLEEPPDEAIANKLSR